jgi:hypothetical protein
VGVDAGERAGVESDRIHHQLHGAESGEPDAFECETTFGALRCDRAFTDEWYRLEAEIGDRGEYPTERELVRIPYDRHAPIDDVDVDASYAGQCIETASNRACAVGAVYALGVEYRVTFAIGFGGKVIDGQWRR